jgi:hypothetical protein
VGVEIKGNSVAELEIAVISTFVNQQLTIIDHYTKTEWPTHTSEPKHDFQFTLQSFLL